MSICRDVQEEVMLTAVHQLPVVHNRLRERLARRRSTELTVEAERLHNGEVCLDGEDGGSGALLLREDLSTTLVEDGVDTTDGVLGALDLDEVDGLLERWLGEQARGVADTAGGGDDLSSATVDGIGVKLSKGNASSVSVRMRRGEGDVQ